MVFSRQYNSLDGYWRHNYSTRLNIASGTIKLIRADGHEALFSLSGTTTTAQPPELGRLVQNGTGWLYTTTDQEQFEFDGQGRLTRHSNREGQAHRLTHSSSTVTVQDDYGNSFVFTQDDRYQPLSIEAPGLTGSYQYDTLARLTGVTRTRSGVTEQRLYHYGDSRYPRFLTGITDERGIRYATWTYDDQGRAISSEHANGA
ncbi:hypothetical protein BZL41_08875, partial [Pseudomonas sp. PIC25]